MATALLAPIIISVPRGSVFTDPVWDVVLNKHVRMDRSAKMVTASILLHSKLSAGTAHWIPVKNVITAPKIHCSQMPPADRIAPSAVVEMV